MNRRPSRWRNSFSTASTGSTGHPHSCSVTCRSLPVCSGPRRCVSAPPRTSAGRSGASKSMNRLDERPGPCRVERALMDVPRMVTSMNPGRDRAAVALVCLAAALRIALWLRQRSLWIDEARLGLNIASRSYLSLLPPLDYDQSAPLLYLWIERFTVAVFGVSDASLRLPALAAGIATVALIYFVARRLFGRPAALLATAMSATVADLDPFQQRGQAVRCRGMRVMCPRVPGTSVAGGPVEPASVARARRARCCRHMARHPGTVRVGRCGPRSPASHQVFRCTGESA